MTKYIFRIDDVYRQMDYKKFCKLRDIFLKYDVPAILGVTPNWKLKEVNNINLIKVNRSLKEFIAELKFLESKNWQIALHGYTHELIGNGGILKINNFGEFAGLRYKEQYERIKKAKNILKKWGFNPSIFIAPAHSYDLNTLKALKANKINIVSDGIGLYPWIEKKLFFVPQILWRPRKMPFGIVTICLHPHLLSNKQIIRLEKFIKKNKKNIYTINSALIKIKRHYFFINKAYRIGFAFKLHKFIFAFFKIIR